MKVIWHHVAGFVWFCSILRAGVVPHLGHEDPGAVVARRHHVSSFKVQFACWEHQCQTLALVFL